MRTKTVLVLTAAATLALVARPFEGRVRGAESPALQPQRHETNATLTAVPGIKVGHFTLAERPTGCTVILVDGDAVGGVSQQGGAPGTRETDLLDPLNICLL